MARWLPLVTCAFALSACDVLTEPLPRALKGEYDAVWTTLALNARGLPVGGSGVCEGSIRIDRASDSEVVGSYLITPGPGCPVSSGELRGVVRRDGGLSLSAGLFDVWLGGCVTSGVELAFTGFIEEDDITLTSRTAVECEELGISSIRTDLEAHRR